MEDFEKILKVCNRLTENTVSVSFDGSKYAYYVGGTMLGKDATISGLTGRVKQYLLDNILDMAFVDVKSVQTVPKLRQKNGVDGAKGDILKTRGDWSVGKAGDPRKSRPRGRKRGRKSFTKTEIIAFMRKRFNGRFSSEQITYKQYCDEFIKEHKRADNREWWRENRGKGSYDKMELSVRVKK